MPAERSISPTRIEADQERGQRYLGDAMAQGLARSHHLGHYMTSPKRVLAMHVGDPHTLPDGRTTYEAAPFTTRHSWTRDELINVHEAMHPQATR